MTVWHLPVHPVKQEGRLVYIILLLKGKQRAMRKGRLPARLQTNAQPRHSHGMWDRGSPTERGAAALVAPEFWLIPHC